MRRAIRSTGLIAALAMSGCAPTTAAWTDDTRFELAVASAQQTVFPVLTFTATGGCGVGPGRFRSADDVAIGPDGRIFVVDRLAHTVHLVDASGGISAFAGDGTLGDDDGVGAAASFRLPFALSFGADGMLWVRQQAGSLNRRVTPAAEVSTEPWNGGRILGDAAGARYALGTRLLLRAEAGQPLAPYAGSGAAGFADGAGTAAMFANVSDAWLATDGTVWVADAFAVRRVDPDGTVTTVAGSAVQGSVDGVGAAAGFGQIGGILADASGAVWVLDRTNRAVRRVLPDGSVTTVATTAHTDIWGLAIDGAGSLYFLNRGGCDVLRVSPVSTDW